MTNSNNNIQRVRYFDRQLLSADDFNTEQKYHRTKLAKLVERFPWGIVSGLQMSCHQKDDSQADDVDAFEIQPGLAVDQKGNTIVVSEALRVPVDEFDEDQPYLSLKYKEKEICVGNSACDKPSRNNRIVELVEHGWRATPNPFNESESWITVAKVREKTANDEKKLINTEKEKICGNYVIVIEDGQEIRRDASLIQEDQIAKNAITADKLEDGAVTSAKIPFWVEGSFPETGVKTEHLQNGAVTTDKLASDIEARPIGPATGDLDGEYPAPTIRDDAVKSAQIAAWQEGSDPETGVKTEHLQNGAVTTEKLASDIEARPTGPATGHLDGEYPAPTIRDDAVKSAQIAAWQEGSDPETGVKTEHLQNGAVTTEKIADWDGQEDSTTGITTEHLRNGAVTSNKLSLIAILEEGSLDSRPDEVTVMAEPNAIIQVIPTSEGELSWTSKVKRASSSANQLEYTITITNNEEEAVQYQIRKINLGLLIPQSQ